MPRYETLYYPAFEPPIMWLRAMLLFFDTVRTIVPKDARFKPSPSIMKIVDALPDSVKTIHPKADDIQIDSFNRDALRKAFQEIKQSVPKQNSVRILISPDGQEFEIGGYVFMHDGKLSDQIRELLFEYHLINSEARPYVEAFGMTDFSAVNRKASDLILSLIADSIGRRKGWSTLTDQPLEFIVNALNSLKYGAVGEANSLLAHSVINFEIPREIRYISLNKYLEIHRGFADLREPFQTTILELSNLNRLGNIDDKETLQERIRQITREFDSELNNLKKSTFGRKLYWTATGIGGLSTLTGMVLSVPAITIPGTLVSVGVNIIQGLPFCQPSETGRARVQRQIARLRKQILDASQVKRLLPI